jgi:hypothetical protein
VARSSPVAYIAYAFNHIAASFTSVVSRPCDYSIQLEKKVQKFTNDKLMLFFVFCVSGFLFLGVCRCSRLLSNFMHDRDAALSPAISLSIFNSPNSVLYQAGDS